MSEHHENHEPAPRLFKTPPTYTAGTEWAASVVGALSEIEGALNQERETEMPSKTHIFAALNDPYEKRLNVFTIMPGQASGMTPASFQEPVQRGLVRVCPVDEYDLKDKHFMKNTIAKRVEAIRNGTGPEIKENPEEIKKAGAFVQEGLKDLAYDIGSTGIIVALGCTAYVAITSGQVDHMMDYVKNLSPELGERSVGGALAIAGIGTARKMITNWVRSPSRQECNFKKENESIFGAKDGDYEELMGGSSLNHRTAVPISLGGR